MSLWKKAAAFLVLSMTLTACGEQQTTPSVTPEETVAAVIEKMQTAESMTSLLTTEASMTAGEEMYPKTTETEIITVYSPLSMKITSTSNVDVNEMVTYIEETDGIATTYMEYAGQWTKQNVEPALVLDSQQLYDTRENIVTYLQSASNWTEVSTEGTEVTLEGTIPAETFKTIIEDTKSLQLEGMAGLPLEYYEGVEDGKIKVTIDTATGLPVSYSVDLGQALGVLWDNAMNTLSGQGADDPNRTVVEKYVLTVAYDDINETKKAEVPKEAIDTAIDFEQQIESVSIPAGENGEELAVE